jgi:hypothetical protein
MKVSGMLKLIGDSDLAERTALLCAVVTSMALFLYTVLTPVSIDNWDILGYAAAALTLLENNVSTVHAEVYGALHSMVDTHSYQLFVNESTYRHVMATDVSAFEQQIPFYKIRLLFILPVSLLSMAGLNPLFSCKLVAGAFLAGGFMLMYLASRRQLSPLFLMSLPAIYFLADGLSLSRLITADAATFFWVALAYFAFMKNSRYFLLVLALSVLTRADLLIFVVLMLTYLGFYSTQKMLHLMSSFILALLIYIALYHWSGSYGWSTTFYFVFVSKLSATHPAIYSYEKISLSDYFYALRAGLYLELYLLIAAVSFIGHLLYQYCVSEKMETLVAQCRRYYRDCMFDRNLGWSMVGVGYIVAHFLLFPALWSRFFVAPIMIIVIGALIAVNGRTSVAHQPSQ